LTNRTHATTKRRKKVTQSTAGNVVGFTDFRSKCAGQYNKNQRDSHRKDSENFVIRWYFSFNLLIIDQGGVDSQGDGAGHCGDAELVQYSVTEYQDTDYYPVQAFDAQKIEFPCDSSPHAWLTTANCATI